jgi:adenylate cyclase
MLTRRQLIPILASLLMLGAAVSFKIQRGYVMESLQNRVFDAFQILAPRTYTPQPVTILDLDDDTLAKIGQWPWPRNKLAEMVDILSNAGAASIAMDIVFAEADRTSPQNILPIWGKTTELSPLLGDLPDHDTLFAQSIANAGNVTTGFVFTHTNNGDVPHQSAGYAIVGDDPTEYVVEYQGSVKGIPIIENNSAGNGALNNIPDNDGIIRSVPLVMRMGNTLYPSLAMEALRIAQGATGYVIKAVGASGEESFGTQIGITAVKNGQFVIPTDSRGRLWIYYTPYTPARVIPLWEVFKPNFDSSRIDGHILFIGTSASGLRDIRATPLDPATSGVEVHAQALEQIMEGQYLSRPDWIAGAELVLMMLAGVILIILLHFSSALWGALFTLTALGGAASFSWWSFTQERLLVDPVTPGIAIVAVYLTGSLAKHILAEKERSEIRNAFSHYMSPALVQQLVSHPEKLSLGGENRELSLLFCDIRGFTTISEQLTATELTQLLNDFLTPMTDIILNKQGTIDKYMGDCIMAFWNAPLDDADHAYHACASALAMLDALGAVNLEQQALCEQHQRTFHPIDIGIGINTGHCSVGNMGSKQRFDYSAIGDTVNLASRLEGQCKTYGVNLVISEHSFRALNGKLAGFEIDAIAVKGKTEPVAIYTLVSETIATHEHYPAFVEHFTKLRASYTAQQWHEAKTHEQAARALGIAALNGLLDCFSERIADYSENPPGEGWDGVFRAVTK